MHHIASFSMPKRSLAKLKILGNYALPSMARWTAEKLKKALPKYHYQLNPPLCKEDLECNVINALDTVTIDEMQRSLYLF